MTSRDKHNPVHAQFFVAVPEAERVSGRLYDTSSWICMGLASDEDKASIAPSVPFKRTFAGCPHTIVIWP